mmetsp:Transcript_8104/g.13061  ORF Transcript_8104/g.13061 Transcript_8104/m.13061 type:complete len:293 (+) Transcript_8104:65-943(+)
MSTPSLRRVILAGGRGFLGNAIKKQLSIAGYKVTLVSRKAGEEDTISWESLENEGLPETDVVINLAGAPILDLAKPWTKKYEQECVDSRVKTTQTLAKLAAESKKKPEVFIATSAVGYYPTSLTAKYTEDYISSASLDGWAAGLCHKIEDASAPASEAGIRTVQMRMGVIMGRGGGAYANMKLPLRLGVGGPFGDGKQWFPWIHLDDAAGLYQFAAEEKKVSGPLNAVSPHCVSNGSFMTQIAHAWWRPAIFAVPAFLLNLIGKDRAAMLLEGQHVVGKSRLENRKGGERKD